MTREKTKNVQKHGASRLRVVVSWCVFVRCNYESFCFLFGICRTGEHDVPRKHLANVMRYGPSLRIDLQG